MTAGRPRVHRPRACNGGHETPWHRRPQQFRERVTADIVDRTTPGGLLQRLPARCQGLAVNHAGRAQLSEIICGIRLAGHGDDLVALSREKVHGDTADAAGCACHRDRPVPGSQAILL